LRNHEIESWALSIIDRVRSGQPIEDQRVELKTCWPDDPKKAARRIAGHANTARGEPILWLIGVDEEGRTVPGIAFIEFASWYSAVKASFDELAPEPIALQVPVSRATVAALYFETDRAPFVCKNAAGGTVQREVPWREATGVNSATRSQLLRLLSPLQKLPSIDVVAAHLDVDAHKSNEGKQFLRNAIQLVLFLTQPSSQTSVIPSHRCTVSLVVGAHNIFGPVSDVQFLSPQVDNINASALWVSITGSGLFEVRNTTFAHFDGSADEVYSQPAHIDLKLVSVGHDYSISIRIDLPVRRKDGEKRGHWGIGSRYSNRTGTAVPLE